MSAEVATSEEFADRMLGVLNNGILALMTSIGHRGGDPPRRRHREQRRRRQVLIGLQDALADTMPARDMARSTRGPGDRATLRHEAPTWTPTWTRGLPMEEPPQDRPAGLLRGATEELLERLRTLADLTRSAGSSTLGALPGPLPGAAGDVLSSLRRLVEQAPPPTAAIDLLLEEIQAKRALVQAMQVQLASFDSQLEVLQHSLEPVQAWGRQWTAVQEGLMDALRLPGGEDDATRRE